MGMLNNSTMGTKYALQVPPMNGTGFLHRGGLTVVKWRTFRHWGRGACPVAPVGSAYRHVWLLWRRRLSVRIFPR